MSTIIEQIVKKYSTDIPENLKAKAVVVSPAGVVGRVVKCTAFTEHHERLYRLRYTYKFSSGAVYELTSDQPFIENDHHGNPVVIGHGWTSDQLAQMGCRYIERDIVEESGIIEAIPVFGN